MDSTAHVYASNWKTGQFNKALFLVALWAAIAAAGSFAKAPLSGLPYYTTADFTPRWFAENNPQLATLHTVSDFAFTDHNNQPVTGADTEGKLSVVNFFFTYCHGICPVTMTNLKEVQRAFGEDPDVILLSHTLTPELDTPKQLTRYAEARGITAPNWHLLTGTQNAIYAHARNAFFADEDLGEQMTQDNNFLHSEYAFLVDQNGHLRGLYNATLPADVKQLVEDLHTLKADLPTQRQVATIRD